MGLEIVSGGSPASLTETQLLLIQLFEECSEVVQRCSKALRFGLLEIEPGQYLTNADRILTEYAEVMATLTLLQDRGAIPRPDFRDLATMLDNKHEKIKKYLAYSRKCGVLRDDIKASST